MGTDWTRVLEHSVDQCAMERGGGIMGRNEVVLLFLLVALPAVALAQTTPNTTDPIEKSALLAFRKVLIDQSNYLTNWAQDTDPCTDSWAGVYCNTSTQPSDRQNYVHVIELRMFNLNLEGHLVPDLGNLSGLLTLDVMWNKLNGGIPDTLGQLSLLKIMTLSGNLFGGAIPESLGNLSHMNRIQLDQNFFTGPLPASFIGLKSLAHLHLNNNSFTGSVPTVLGQLPSLIHILLDNNQLTGPMPPEISNATTLVIIQLDNNLLTGGVPQVYADKLISLTKLSCRNCGLSGPIPDLSNLSEFSVLDLSLNRFNGSIPDMSTLNLTSVDVSGNELVGEIPLYLVDAPVLQTLQLSNNLLSGNIPNFANGVDYTNNQQLLDFQNNSFQYVSVELLTEAAHEANLVLRLSGNPLICNGSQYIPELQNLCTPQQTKPFQSSGDVTNLPKGPPILVSYRLKSPGFSFFTYSYELEFNMYIASGLSIQTTQVAVQSFEWQPGPRLFMIIQINPPVSTKFNTTEVQRIDRLFSNWLPRNSTLFGPYELLGLQFPGGTGSKKLSTGAIAGIAVGGAAIFILCLIGIIVFFYIKKRKSLTPAQKRKQEMMSMRAVQDSLLKVTGVTAFSYKELANATEDFSQTHEVGKGGYGKVYRGVLESGQVVAIKRANLDAIQRNTEFYNEIELLSRCHHRNLVELVGYCNDEEEQMLVYEFMELGTLHDNLHAGGKVKLDFAMRLRIALGSAKGISYLHTEANPPIFHRDIKSNNILLDAQKQAKVADFGLSRLAPDLDIVSGEHPTHVSTVVKGTPGYLDPEYFLTRQLTDKSDVYSFGVVLLELITGMQPIYYGKNIVREVQASYDNGELLQVIDREMGTYPSEVMEPFAKLAMACVQSEPTDRPTMREVARTLETLVTNTLGKDSKGMPIAKEDYSLSLKKDLSFNFRSGQNFSDPGSTPNSIAQPLSSSTSADGLLAGDGHSVSPR